MKKRRSVLALLLVAALTVVLGGCQDGKDGKADSSDTTSSQPRQGNLLWEVPSR